MNVYKYRYGSKRDLRSLKSDYFYAPHPSSLNDPCESLFDINSIEQMLLKLESDSSISITGVRDGFSGFLKIIREKVGIYSLSKTVFDEFLWAYYADSHTGFCIEYDLEKLGQLTKNAGSFDVCYQDAIPQLTFDKLIGRGVDTLTELLKLTSGTKSKKWQHENEIRVIMDNFGEVEYDFRAVKSIYFGLRMPRTIEKDKEINVELPEWIQKVSRDDIIFALQGRGIKYYQIVLKPNSYEFGYIEVEDLYKNVPKYKSNIKPIDKSLIDYNGYGWNVEPSYFDKIAEITCREPYFYKLNLIHVSKDKSIERGEPIIFSGFFKAENDWVQIKRYYSISEIDQLYNDLNV